MQKNNTAKPAAAKHTTKAFANWSTNIGSTTIKSSKGFPLQGHPDYPNKEEDLLIALAEKNGGKIELILKVSINLNTRNNEIEYNADALLAELNS